MRRPTLSLPSSFLIHLSRALIDTHVCRGSRCSPSARIIFTLGHPHIFVIVSRDRNTDKLTGYGVPQTLISGCPTVILMRVFASLFARVSSISQRFMKETAAAASHPPPPPFFAPRLSRSSLHCFPKSKLAKLPCCTAQRAPCSLRWMF